MRWLSIFRDPRIWLVILLAALVRVGWTAWWTWELQEGLAVHEAEMERLSPEDRAEAELRTADTLARELFGVELGSAETLAALEQAAIELDPDNLRRAGDSLELDFEAALEEVSVRRQRPQVPMSAIPVIRYDEPPGWEPPAWMLAGALGGLFLIAGGAASLYVLRASEDDEEPDAPDAPPT